MHVVLHRWIPLVALLGTLTGCEPEAVAGPPLHEVETDLTLVAPMISPSLLVAETFDTLAPLPNANGPSASDVGDDFRTRPLQQIWQASSRGAFVSGQARFLATHSYIGNVGSIDSFVNLDRNGQFVRSIPSRSQQYTPFVFDFGRVKQMFHPTSFDVEDPCGYTLSGRSQHKAWWEFYQGRSAPNWGVAEVPSYAREVHGACTTSRGTRGGRLEEDGGRVCTVLITYDLATGEIYNVEVLSCYSVGDEKL